MVASALERALEADGRRVLNGLFDLERKVLDGDMEGVNPAIPAVQRYLTGLKTIVGVDYLHARIVDRSSGNERFILVTAGGQLCDRHSTELPSISRQEGSMRNAIAAATQGRYLLTNTREETEKCYANVSDSNDWEFSRRNFKTVATLLIGSPEEPVGSLVF